MKLKNIFSIAALAAMTALTGCDENSWNEELEGFDPDYNPTQVETMEYTLTAADYKAIASNSANKAAAEAAGLSNELAAVSKNSFPAALTPRDYIPNYLNTPTSPVFYYTDGSSVKLTYNVETALPECVYDAAAAETYKVGEADYISTWESDENFIEAFAPSHSAAASLPAILKAAYPDAEKGAYVIVNYNETEQEPIFGTVGGGETPDTPNPPAGFEMSSVVASVSPDDEVEIKGVVSGVCTNGFTLTDNSATIFVYMGGGWDVSTYPVGTQMSLLGSATSYNGNLQIAKGAEIETFGTQEVVYPAPTVYDGAALDAVLNREANLPCVYTSIVGTLSISGNYFNVEVDGAETAKGSIYGVTDEFKAQLADGATAKLTGWFVSISGGRYCNIVLTKVEAASAAKRAAAVEVPTTSTSAIYTFDGSKWSVPSDMTVLTHADYQAMGQKYDNLSSSAAPANYLPTYLSQKYPYAQAEDVRYVVYNYYSGSTSVVCDMYTYNGSEWVLNTGIVEESAQYVRTGGKWIFNPNVTITLPAGKNQELSTLYYQTCVNWVFENICKPLGDTDIKSGKFYVTSYGNNEYYCGSSAYQGNVDLRAGSARSQYAEGWEGYTDEQIVETMKKRFTEEVLLAVMSELHPDAVPMEGLDVIYTVNFASYNGSKTSQNWVTYKVVAQGKFEFVECFWGE